MSINLNRQGLAKVTRTDDWQSNAWLLAMQISTYTTCALQPYPTNTLIIQYSISFLIKKEASPILYVNMRETNVWWERRWKSQRGVTLFMIPVERSSRERPVRPDSFACWDADMMQSHISESVSIIGSPRAHRGPRTDTRRLNITCGSAWLAIYLSDTYLRSSTTCQQGGAPIERERL